MRLLLANALLLGALIWATLVDVGDLAGGSHAEPARPSATLVDTGTAEPKPDDAMPDDVMLEDVLPDDPMPDDGKRNPAVLEQVVTKELAPEVAAVSATALEPSPKSASELTPEWAMESAPAPAAPAIHQPVRQPEPAEAPVPEQARSTVAAPTQRAATPDRAALEDLAAELEAVFFERLP